MIVVLVILISCSRYVDEGSVRRGFRRHWQCNRITVELLEDEIRSSSDVVKNQMLWLVVTKARRFKDGFVLFQGRDSYWLPPQCNCGWERS